MKTTQAKIPDPRNMTDEQLRPYMAEWHRRALAKQPTPRARVLAPCKKCGEILGAVERRACPKCAAMKVALGTAGYTKRGHIRWIHADGSTLLMLPGGEWSQRTTTRKVAKAGKGVDSLLAFIGRAAKAVR